ncbi:MAG TPA: hypothetical protein VFW34_07775 [Candidatus Rubrimentiphilum sp.]|nr:hypothetical protein [Candidatus Rubrimentiphilum sp.]
MLVFVQRRRNRKVPLDLVHIGGVMFVRMTMHLPTLMPVQMQMPVMRVPVPFFSSKIAQRKKRNPRAEKYECTTRYISQRCAQSLRCKYSHEPHNKRER